MGKAEPGILSLVLPAYSFCLGFRAISWNIGGSVCRHLLYDRFLFLLMERLRLEKFRVCLLLLS